MNVKSLAPFGRVIVLYILLLCSSTLADEALLIFGGRDHDVFLGCVNAGKYDDSSIWNAYGDYGSPYSDKSIWNRYGDYGGKYSDTSPWNQYASHPPVIVDRTGGFYGYFTANRYQDKRTQLKNIIWLIDNYDWVIDHLDEVREKM